MYSIRLNLTECGVPVKVAPDSGAANDLTSIMVSCGITETPFIYM